MANKIIAVTGATGTQGGGVVNVMKKTPGWTVRAITRNPNSESAKKLAAEGIEVAKASFDDEESIVAAFKGVSAVFAVTNWWEHLFAGKTREESSVAEVEQGMRVARAAARTPTLEHYMWSTEPSAENHPNSKYAVCHFDSKARVNVKIKEELPELAAKTTFLNMGYYPENMFTFPFVEPKEYPVGSGTYIQIMPCPPEAKIPMSGDMSLSPGVWVRQVLAKAPLTYGKLVNVSLGDMSFGEMLNIWAEVMGKKAVYVPCSIAKYEELWGIPGLEMGLQIEFGDQNNPWEETEEYVSREQLGITDDDVIDFRGVMQKWKGRVA